MTIVHPLEKNAPRKENHPAEFLSGSFEFCPDYSPIAAADPRSIGYGPTPAERVPTVRANFVHIPILSADFSHPFRGTRQYTVDPTFGPAATDALQYFRNRRASTQGRDESGSFGLLHTPRGRLRDRKS